MIAVYDSGVGGLTILRELRSLLPSEDLLFVADQAHLPYGSRSLEEVRCFARGISGFLIERGAAVVVIACNTASAAALHELRAEFPGLPFVGMEPAVKPAAEESRTRRVAVIATQATFQGRLFESVVERFAEGVEVLRQPCPGLVELIEKDCADTRAQLYSMLAAWLLPLKARGIDRLVLGCTHYPLVRNTIEEILGPSVTVIDPAPAVARQVRRVLEKAGSLHPQGRQAAVEYLTTARDPERFAAQISRFVGETRKPKQLLWEQGRLLSC